MEQKLEQQAAEWIARREQIRESGANCAGRRECTSKTGCQRYTPELFKSRFKPR
jgi:hypothetical protein